MFSNGLAIDVKARWQPLSARREATVFGLREFKTKGTQFTINGRTTFLRGKHDACVFPLTGHPPMDVEAWKRYFRTASLTASITSASTPGARPMRPLLRPTKWASTCNRNFPIGRPFDGKSAHDRYLWQEAERIVQTFGNHPSFVMLSLGNEMGGDTAAMARLVKHLHEIDPRHLYAQGSNNFFWKPNLGRGRRLLDHRADAGRPRCW